MLQSFTLFGRSIINAAKNGDFLKVKELVKNDPHLVKVKDKSNSTALHHAAAKGYLDIAEYLCNKGADVRAKNDKGNTPLHEAVSSGKVDMVVLLLKKKADINAVNVQMCTPLHEAIINGKVEISKILIEKGSDLNSREILGRTTLHLAARYNCKPIAGLLINKGVDIDSKDNAQRTPLNLLTLMTENFEIAALLIKKGANINAKDVNRMMPLNYAAHGGSLDLINLLVEHKADFSNHGKHARNMIYFAANLGSVRLFNYVVQKEGKDLFKNKSDNELFMRVALSGGSVDIVKMLHKRDIPINVEANIYGWTPLHYAARKNKPAMIEFLVKNGADIKKRTNSGKSAYNIADEKGHKDILRKILKLGGNSEPQKFPILTGPYLGQTPPKNRSKIFAPGIISSDHSSVTISPDGQEIYWYSNSSIMTTKLRNGQWTVPEIVSFSGKSSVEFYDDVPFVSPDNSKLFFTSLRPMGSMTKKENIWYTERTSNGWSEPKPISIKVNAIQLHWQISVSNSGTLYFGGQEKDGYGKSDIYYSWFIDGEYIKPVNLGAVINSKEDEGCPYIAPDESYIIFNRIISGRVKFYVSFRTKEGQWLKPISLEKYIKSGTCPNISHDGKYLFYYSRGDIRWVSAKFIEYLRSKILQ